jgi:hypothetical protein
MGGDVVRWSGGTVRAGRAIIATHCIAPVPAFQSARRWYRVSVSCSTSVMLYVSIDTTFRDALKFPRNMPIYSINVRPNGGTIINSAVSWRCARSNEARRALLRRVNDAVQQADVTAVLTAVAKTIASFSGTVPLSRDES